MTATRKWPVWLKLPPGWPWWLKLLGYVLIAIVVLQCLAVAAQLLIPPGEAVVA